MQIFTMRRNLLIILQILTCVQFLPRCHVSCYLFPLATRLQLPGTPSPPGSIWPLPQIQTSTSQLVTLASKENFQYSVNFQNCKPLNEAIQKRYKYETIFHENAVADITLPILSTVAINIPTELADNLCDLHPKLNNDTNYEKYNLSISLTEDESQASAQISASTVWGALRGLETFSQLIWRKRIESLPIHYYANVTEISDWPRFPHRGLMIDSARHFLSPDVILQIMDGMAYNKLNVLHWHIVDDQSFPYQSQKFPDLSAKGAFIPGALEYSPQLVQHLIEEARLRGIRVIFEFDTPGHTFAFGLSYPELLTPCYGDGVNPGTPNYGLQGHGPYEILDPTKNFTYTFMQEFFSELVFNISKDEFVHLGMDEVYYYCWDSSPEIRAFMDTHGYTNMSQVQQHYTEIHLEMIKNLGAKRIIWQDPLDFGVQLDKDVVLQIWKSERPWQEYFQKALNLGHQVLLSSCWYLNYINYGQSWRAYYECDPVLSLPNEIPEEQIALILGGEGAIWGEFVDSTNVVQRFFPFVNAVAERLWSRMNSSTTDDAMWRLDEQRCRMLWRGLPAQPIFNSYCSSREYKFTPGDGNYSI